MSSIALLLSGGMDSLALAWALRPRLCITIDYGQLAAAGEIRAAAAVCGELGMRHRIVRANCGDVGSGDMAGAAALQVAPVSEWWPFRNQLLITLAAAVALQDGHSGIALGVVANDASHADGRVQFYDAMRQLLAVQEGHLSVETPAIDESTVAMCRRVAVPYGLLAWAHSCHISDFACGTCRGCVKHRSCMRELGFGEY